jgi:hypothetical protein
MCLDLNKNQPRRPLVVVLLMSSLDKNKYDEIFYKTEASSKI